MQPTESRSFGPVESEQRNGALHTMTPSFAEKASPKTHASMFSGVGGFDLGLQRVGFRTVWANDIDKYACQVYRKNLDGSVLVEGDIREVDAKQIPDHDLLSAGFPCQAFSLAGKRKGINESRGTLFYHIYRVAKVKRPKLLLLENVKGLLSNESGRTFATIIRLLEGLGYLIEWQVLNSKYFGVPQNRERVFIIGHSRDRASKQIFPIGEACNLSSEENGSEQEVEKGIRSSIFPAVMENNRCEVRSVVAQTLEASYGKTESLTNTIAKTLQGGGHSGGLHSNMTLIHAHNSIAIKTAQALQTDGFLRQGSARNIRRLTPIECERLQGFPDNYTKFGITYKKLPNRYSRKEASSSQTESIVEISDTQRYKLLGNAVTVNVVEFLGKKLMEALQ